MQRYAANRKMNHKMQANKCKSAKLTTDNYMNTTLYIKAFWKMSKCEHELWNKDDFNLTFTWQLTVQHRQLTT